MATALVVIMMSVGATGLNALFGPSQPPGHGWWDHTVAGLAIVGDPISGVGVAAPLWVAAIVVVGLVTRASTGPFRLFLGASVTVVVSAMTLMIASVAALVHGQVADQTVAMTMVVVLLFLVAAITSLALVNLVIFRDRHRIPAYIRARERSFTRAA